MTKTNWSALISDLREEDRRAVEEKIKMLRGVMRTCEVYLQDYAAGRQTVLKFLTTTEWVCREITETRSVLVTSASCPAFLSAFDLSKRHSKGDLLRVRASNSLSRASDANHQVAQETGAPERGKGGMCKDYAFPNTSSLFRMIRFAH